MSQRDQGFELSPWAELLPVRHKFWLDSVVV